MESPSLSCKVKKRVKSKKDVIPLGGEHGFVHKEVEVDSPSLACKVKKARKSKKDHTSSILEHELVHMQGELAPPSLADEVITHQNPSGKVKSKKGKKNSKDHISKNSGNRFVYEEGQNEPDKDKVSQISSLGNALSGGIKSKAKKPRRSKKKDHLPSESETGPRGGEVEPFEVYQISSGEEDASKGMKKWMKEYHENRPGLKVLQQRIDDFITEYEAQEDQARKQREAAAAEGGWTVVVHRKGGKKTTDPESGVAVGSVNQAAVLDKVARKKSKDVGLDFYRFQRREAQRNEIMKLQSKFEEDKKRIQQLRAARKFRPY
ncbi:hypothetical protein Dimus_023112 [Dionaea muscipula]